MPYSSISEVQNTQSLPTPGGIASGTDLLVAPLALQQQFQHFWDLLYDLRSDTHLARLLTALLGQSGVGSLRKQMLLARMSSIRTGVHFYDIDRFWGSLYGIPRRVEEAIGEVDMSSSLATQEEWNELEEADAAYRNRVFLFGQAVHHCPTPLGIELLAEAMTTSDCQVYEMWQGGLRRTWNEVEQFTLDQMDQMTMDELEEAPSQSDLVGTSIVRPRRPLTLAEIHEVGRVLETLRPVTSRLIVDPLGVPVYRRITPRAIFSPSNYWEVHASYQPVDAGEIDVEQPPVLERVPPLVHRQAAVITLNSDVKGLSSYAMDDGSVVSDVDMHAEYDSETGRLVFDGPNAALKSSEAMERARVGLDLNAWPHQSRMFSTEGGGPFSSGHGVVAWNIDIDDDDLSGQASFYLSSNERVGKDSTNQENVYWASKTRNWADTVEDVLEFEFLDDREISEVEFDLVNLPIDWHLEFRRNGRWEIVGSGRVPAPGWVEDIASSAFELTTTTTTDSEIVTSESPPVYATEYEWVAEYTHGRPSPSLQPAHTQASYHTSPSTMRERKWSRSPTSPPSFPRLLVSDDHYHRSTDPYNEWWHTHNYGKRQSAQRSGNTRQVQISAGSTQTHRRTVNRTQETVQFSEDVPQSGWHNVKVDIPDEYQSKQVSRCRIRFSRYPVLSNGDILMRDFLFPIRVRGLRIQKVITTIEQLEEFIEVPQPPIRKEITDTVATYSGMTWTADRLVDDKSWRSDIQMAPDAIVPLYIDTRNQSGDPQVIDRLWMDPIWESGRVHVYWSNDDPDPDDLDEAGRLRLHETTEVVGDVEYNNSGIHFPDEHAWIDLPANEIGFDPSRTWGFATKILMRRPTNDSAVSTVFDFEGRRLVVGNGQVRFLLGSGRQVVADVDISSNTNIYVSGHADDQSAVLRVEWDDEMFASHRTGSSLSGQFDGTMRLGASGNPDHIESAPFDGIVRNFTLVQGNIDVDVEVADSIPGAIWAFFPAWISATNPTGGRGGQGNPYRTLDWNRYPVDHKVERGYLYLPKVATKYLCLEFTNHPPMIDDNNVVFDREMLSRPLEDQGHTSGVDGAGSSDPGQQRLMNTVDLATSSPPVVDSNGGDVMPDTEGMYYENIEDRQRTQTGHDRWDHRFEQWHHGSQSPHSEGGAIHYDTRITPHGTQIGYACGLRELHVIREDYATVDDTEVYRERFHDNSSIHHSNWQMDPGHLFSTFDFSELVSKVWKSHNRIYGIQFASQQSNAVQVLPDDDFRDVSVLESTSWDDEEQWHSYGGANIVYDEEDHAVVLYWSNITTTVESPDFEPIVVEPVHPVSGGGETTFVNPPSGGIESPSVNVSPDGYAWAAVRYTPSNDPPQPYVLQIVNGLNGDVLKSKEVEGSAGEVREETLEYNIGSVAGDVPLRVRFLAVDTVKVDTLSLFDEAIVWDFSVNGGRDWHMANRIRNNPNGFLHFPDPGRELCWRIRGYRPDLNIDSLQVRPWYEGLVPSRGDVQLRGPNISTYDTHPPIYEDPEFSARHSGVPYMWFLRSRRYPILNTTGIAQMNSRFIARASLDEAPVEDVASRQLTLDRTIVDVLPTVDTADHKGSSFSRDIDDAVDVDDEAIGIPMEERTIVRPPDGPPSSKD